MTNILCFGDSITFGEYDGVLGGWADILKRHYHRDFREAQGPEVHLFNLGIGGETTEGLMQRFATEASARKRDHNLILLAYGANDLVIKDGRQQVPVNRYIKNLDYALGVAKRMTPAVFLISVLPVADRVDGIQTASGKIRSNENVLLYNQELKALARRCNVSYIDTYTAFRGAKENLLSIDGVHPNERGYQFLAGIIRNTVNRYL